MICTYGTDRWLATVRKELVSATAYCCALSRAPTPRYDEPNFVHVRNLRNKPNASERTNAVNNVPLNVSVMFLVS